MTQNQIAFNKAIEDRRHNIETERLSRFDNESRRLSALAAERQAAATEGRLLEEQRANQERERVNWYLAQETARNNLRLEELNQYRSDLESSDRNRSVDVNAQLEREKMVISRYSAESGRISALASDIAARAKALTAQTNIAALAETSRANLARESETKRSNMEAERISRLRHYESVRHAKETESLSGGELSEKTRHNVASENVANQQLDISQYEAATRRGAAYAEGFKDVTLGISNITDVATDIYNLVKGVKSDARKEKIRKAWLDIS